MVRPKELAGELRMRIDSHFEWLLVRANGRTFPLRRTEIDVECKAGKVLFGVVDDKGFEVSRVRSIAMNGDELVLELSARSGDIHESASLIPRPSARELSKTVELARLERANLFGRALLEAFPAYKLSRIALSHENGRLAQIFARNITGKEIALMIDLTGTMVHEAMMTSAILWSEKLKTRKKPVNEVWIAGERKQARSLQKLMGLLNASAALRFRVFEIVNEAERPKLKELKRPPPSALWREKPRKLNLPPSLQPSETASKIIALAPDKTDVIFSKQGETIRFLGLPFARVRTIAGHEKGWFGLDRNRIALNQSTWSDLATLVEELNTYRSEAQTNNRHELYRAAPEAWLESILRRNIRALDANLILSPLYNQFRASADKIDLLAIRRDGRLVIIELKTSPDRETVFQAADYWRKIEIQRRRGELRRIKAFGEMEILDRPALVYVVAPALNFHRDFALFSETLSREIELWRFELHEDWRREIRVLRRRTVEDHGSARHAANRSC